MFNKLIKLHGKCLSNLQQKTLKFRPKGQNVIKKTEHPILGLVS